MAIDGSEMITYAVHDGATVVNVIVAESPEIASTVSGDLEVLETNSGVPGIGWTLEPDGWRPPSPYASWVWDGSVWSAPLPMPDSNDTGWYVWDEDAQDWLFITAPEPQSAPPAE